MSARRDVPVIRTWFDVHCANCGWDDNGSNEPGYGFDTERLALKACDRHRKVRHGGCASPVLTVTEHIRRVG